MFCWSFSYIASKIALQTFSVNALIVTRFSIASFIFLVLLYFKGFPKFSTKDHIKIIFTSTAFPFAYYYLETMALSYTTATEASVLSAIIPVVVLILSAIFIKEKITLIASGGVIFSFVGIVILIFGNPGQKFELNGNFLGNTLMLGSVLSFSIYMILTRSLGGKYTAFEITSVQTIYGTILFFIFCFCLTPHKFQIKSIGFENISAIMFLSIFATIVAFLCYNFALARISATKASLFVNSVPVITS
jgi:drug/metabolite transporter (DMT)-like permease